METLYPPIFGIGTKSRAGGGAPHVPIVQLIVVEVQGVGVWVQGVVVVGGYKVPQWENWVEEVFLP